MFNFNFGKKKPDIKQYAIISVVLTTIIATLSQCTGISQNNIWDLLDEVQRKYFPQTILNEFILNDPEKLNRRITRDVDRAIARRDEDALRVAEGLPTLAEEQRLAREAEDARIAAGGGLDVGGIG